MQARCRLIRMNLNLITLTATLYFCSLINLTPLIADYNVSHSAEAAGKGIWLDTNYLLGLGPQALPAIDRAIALGGFGPTLVSRRGCLVEQQRRYGILARLGLSQLAAAAHPRGPTEEFDRRLIKTHPRRSI
jgi:hypothetical protein